MRVGEKSMRFTVRVLYGAWIGSAALACSYVLVASSHIRMLHPAAGSMMNAPSYWLPPMMVVGARTHVRPQRAANLEPTTSVDVDSVRRRASGDLPQAVSTGANIAPRTVGFVAVSAPEMQTTTQTPPSSVTFGPSASIWRRAGQRYHIDPLLLYAVALVETGRASGSDSVAPTPWIVRIDGRVITGSASHVREAIRLAQAFGKQIQDVGIMQVYFPAHHTTVRSALQLIDPRTNIMQGARILAQALGSSQDTILGIGHYHSDNPSKAYSYGSAVYTVWHRLEALERGDEYRVAETDGTQEQQGD